MQVRVIAKAELAAVKPLLAVWRSPGGGGLCPWKSCQVINNFHVIHCFLHQNLSAWDFIIELQKLDPHGQENNDATMRSFGAL